MKKYFLHIPDDVEKQLSLCRAPIRESIRKRLKEIVESVAAKALLPLKAAVPMGPPLRFYVYEGYRISYQVNPLTRRVSVLKLRTESS